MATLAQLIVRIGADTGAFTSQFSAVNAAVNTFQRDLDRNVGGISRLGQSLQSVGLGLAASVSLPLAGAGVAALKAAGQMEQARTALTTLNKSAAAANQQLAELRDFAAKTPFQFTELLDASRRMQALGFSAKEVIPMLRQIGDAAGSLGMGAEGINRIVLALGQMRAKGAAQGEEMRQLAEAGIPAWEALAKALNTTVANAMKLVEKRAVDSTTAIKAITAAMGDRFGGGMEAQAKTLLGIWSNLKDRMQFALADMGEALAPVAKDIALNVIDPLIKKVAELAKEFRDLPRGAQQTVIGIGGIAAAAPIAVVAIGTLLTNLKAIAPVAAIVGKALAVLGGIVATALSSAPGLVIGGAVLLASGAVALAREMRARGIQAQIETENAVGKALAIINAGAIPGAAVAKAYEDGQAAARAYAAAVAASADASKTSAEAADTNASNLRRLRDEYQELGVTLGKTKFGPELSPGMQAWLDFVNDREMRANGEAQAFVFGAIASGALNMRDGLLAAGSAAGDYGVAAQRAAIATEELQAGIASLPNRRTSFEVLRLAVENLKASIRASWSEFDTFNAKMEEVERNRKPGGYTPTELVMPPGIEKGAQRASEAMKQVSTVVTDLSRGIADLIFEGVKFGDMMESVAKQAGKALVRYVLEGALMKIAGQLTGILGKLPGLGRIFGSGASAGTAVGGGAGGLGGSLGGATGWASGLLSGGISAIGSVISGFIVKGAVDGLKRVQQDTNTMLTHQIDVGQNIYLAALPGIHERLREIRAIGVRVFTDDSIVDVRMREGSMAGAGGGGVNINFPGTMVVSPSSIDDFARMLADRMRMLGLIPKG